MKNSQEVAGKVGLLGGATVIALGVASMSMTHDRTENTSGSDLSVVESFQQDPLSMGMGAGTVVLGGVTLAFGALNLSQSRNQAGQESTD